MKAIVKKVEPNGTYDSQYGLMYKYNITIGEHTGEYSSKKYQTSSADGFPFQIDSESEYEFIDGQFPKIKTVSNWSGGGGGYSAKKSSNTSFGVSYCKDLIVAGKLDVKDWQIASEKIINFMNKLDNK